MSITPGPWTVDEDEEGNCFIRIPNGHDLCFGDMETTEACCFANARLIAASPELLEACDATIDFLCEYGSGPRTMELVKKVKAAIAKARGEA